MIATVHTKTFQEIRYMKRAPGAEPDSWEHMSSSDSIDDQVNRCSADTGAVIDSISAPGISQLWCDESMTVKCIVIAFLVMYYNSGR